MTKLKKYNTLSDWETAKGGGDLLYPSVGLIKENSSVVYMPPPPIHTLPIKAVFYDSSTGSFVKLYPDQITEANPNYTPIGVEVVPAEHDVYGTGQAGVMSLAEMSYNNPDVGTSSNEYDHSMYWGGYKIDTSLPNYSFINYIGQGPTLNDGVVQGIISSAYLPSDKFTKITGLDGESGYSNNSTSYRQAPSPYNADGSRNEAYYTTVHSTANALSDFDGVVNTKVLTDLATGQSNWKTATNITNNSVEGVYPPACCCWRFHTSGTDQGQWYLPAAGEFGYVINRILAINTTINKVKSVYPSVVALEVASDEYIRGYWSSSEGSDYKGVSLVWKSGSIGLSDKNSGCNARAFLRL